MAVFRVEKTRNYTTMSNFHLRDKRLSLKAKGLMSLILSLPDNWNYSIAGLAAISKESRDGIGTAIRELEANGYVVRNRLRRPDGKLGEVEYVIYEQPIKELPVQENPAQAKPVQGFPTQLNTNQTIKEKMNKRPNGYRPRAGPGIGGKGYGFEDYSCKEGESY